MTFSYSSIMTLDDGGRSKEIMTLPGTTSWMPCYVLWAATHRGLRAAASLPANIVKRYSVISPYRLFVPEEADLSSSQRGSKNEAIKKGLK